MPGLHHRWIGAAALPLLVVACAPSSAEEEVDDSTSGMSAPATCDRSYGANGCPAGQILEYIGALPDKTEACGLFVGPQSYNPDPTNRRIVCTNYTGRCLVDKARRDRCLRLNDEESVMRARAGAEDAPPRDCGSSFGGAYRRQCDAFMVKLDAEKKEKLQAKDPDVANQDRDGDDADAGVDAETDD